MSRRAPARFRRRIEAIEWCPAGEFYGFQVRGLRRLQRETLGDNHAMMAVAAKLGFTRDGMTRRLVVGERKVL